MFGYFLVRKYAPEAGGSGIRKLKGRWKINVPFAGGVCCREILWRAGNTRRRHGAGPRRATVQIGGNIGRMVLDIFRLKVTKRAIRCWQPVLLRGWLRP